MDKDTNADEGKDAAEYEAEDTTEDGSETPANGVAESTADEKSGNTDKDSTNPKRKKMSYKKKMRLLYGVLVLAIAAAVTCGVWLMVDINTTKQAQEYYASLTDDVEKHPRNEYYQPGSQLPAPTDTADPGDGVPDVDEVVWTPYVDFDDLNARFQPITAAWLVIEGTIIDYPVMHREGDKGNNDDYFLRRLPDGTSHRNGSLYIDGRNSPDFTDKNTVIYGHNMKSGDMFGSLKEYRSQEYYEQHPVVYIYTPTKDYALVLFAGYNLDSAYEVPPMTFKDTDAFLSHIANIKRRSVFRSDVEVGADDLIVSLATCAVSSNRNARLILVGRLVELSGLS